MSKDWLHASAKEIENMTVDEAFELVEKQIDLGHSTGDYRPREHLVKAFEIVLMCAKSKVKVNKNERNFRYKTLDQLFEHWYSTGHAWHEPYLSSLTVGDVVATAGGLDIGLYGGEGIVYARTSRWDYLTKFPGDGRPRYGGNSNWYKCGLNVSYEEWNEVSLQAEERERVVWMKKK